jgi:hypothetical protein
VRNRWSYPLKQPDSALRPPPDRWEFYKDRFDQWQWRKFEEWKVVAVSGDGYFSKQACVNNARGRGYSGS